MFDGVPCFWHSVFLGDLPSVVYVSIPMFPGIGGQLGKEVSIEYSMSVHAIKTNQLGSVNNEKT